MYKVHRTMDNTKKTNLMISQSSSTVLLESSPPSDATPSLGGEGMLTDDCLLAASWALSYKVVEGKMV